MVCCSFLSSFLHSFRKRNQKIFYCFWVFEQETQRQRLIKVSQLILKEMTGKMFPV